MGYNNKFCKHGIPKSPFTQQGEIVNDTTMNMSGVDRSFFYEPPADEEELPSRKKKRKKEKKPKGKKMKSNRKVPTTF